jgi:hypothetical protein
MQVTDLYVCVFCKLHVPVNHRAISYTCTSRYDSEFRFHREHVDTAEMFLEILQFFLALGPDNEDSINTHVPLGRFQRSRWM